MPIDATLGERIRFYRQPAGLTQKELAGLCEVNESAISGEKITEMEDALQALYKLEEIYGLYPTEADGHIHFVFRDSIVVGDLKPDINAITRSPGTLLRYRILEFMKACAQHDAGEMTDEEYVLWKSKFPAFLSDFYKFRKQAGKAEVETFKGDAPVPSEKLQSLERSRERKINSER